MCGGGGGGGGGFFQKNTAIRGGACEKISKQRGGHALNGPLVYKSFSTLYVFMVMQIKLVVVVVICTVHRSRNLCGV